MEKFWSICSMPIGLLLCFFPVLIAWVIAGSKPDEPAPRTEKKH
jgi:hypothetical protein